MTAAVVPFAEEQATFLAALAEKGTQREALLAAGVSRSALRGWMRSEAFTQAAEDAEREYTDGLIAKGLKALESASDEQLLQHPNLHFFHIKARDERYRDKVPMAQVAVQVNLADKLSWQRVEEIAGQCEAEA